MKLENFFNFFNFKKFLKNSKAYLHVRVKLYDAKEG